MGHSDRMFAGGLGSLFVWALEFIIGSHFAEKLHAGYTVSLDDLNDLRATCNVAGFW